MSAEAREVERKDRVTDRAARGGARGHNEGEAEALSRHVHDGLGSVLDPAALVLAREQQFVEERGKTGSTERGRRDGEGGRVHGDGDSVSATTESAAEKAEERKTVQSELFGTDCTEVTVGDLVVQR